MRLSRSPAVAPILATLILVAITFVGSVLVYQIFLRTAAVQGSNARVSIQSAKLLMATSSSCGTGVFSITVENIGNRPVRELTLNISNPVQSCPSPTNAQPPIFNVSLSSPLNPGRNASATGTPAMSFNFNQAYSFTVLATYNDNSTSIVAGSVVAATA